MYEAPDWLPPKLSLLLPAAISKLIRSFHVVFHDSDVIMSSMASQITSSMIVYSTVYSVADQKHQSSASLDFVRGIYRWSLNSPHKGPVTLKMIPFDDVTMPRLSAAVNFCQICRLLHRMCVCAFISHAQTECELTYRMLTWWPLMTRYLLGTKTLAGWHGPPGWHGRHFHSNDIWWCRLSYSNLECDIADSPTPSLDSHYDDVIMGPIASQITSLTIVYSIVN